MHAAQRKAIFAMVDSVENQCRYIKSLLIMEDEVGDERPGPAAGRRQEATPSRPTPGGSEYLSEKEELELEKEHEKQRLAALTAHQARTQEDWSALRKIADEETPETTL